MSSGAKGIQGQVVATLTFSPGVSPPVVQASQGFGPALFVASGPVVQENIPLQDFSITPTEQSGSGAFAFAAPPPGAAGALTQYNVTLDTIDGLSFRQVACEPTGDGRSLRIRVLDAAGNLANATVGPLMRVTILRGYTPGMG